MLKQHFYVIVILTRNSRFPFYRLRDSLSVAAACAPTAFVRFICGSWLKDIIMTQRVQGAGVTVICVSLSRTHITRDAACFSDICMRVRICMI